MPPPTPEAESSSWSAIYAAVASFLSGMALWITSKVRKGRQTARHDEDVAHLRLNTERLLQSITIQHEQQRKDFDHMIRELRELLVEEVKETRRLLYEQRDELLERLQAILVSQQVEVEVQRRIRDRLREED